MSKQKNVPQTANISIWGKIYNLRKKILIDTGAAITAISYDIYKTLRNAGNNLILQKSDISRVTTANDHTLSLKGMSLLQFEIEKRTYPFKAYVISNLNYDVIIGKDFLTEYNVIINLKESKLFLENSPYQLKHNNILENKSHQLDSKYQEILTTKQTFLKPFSTSVLQVSCNLPTKGNYCFEPNPELLYQSNVYLQSTLVSGENIKSHC